MHQLWKILKRLPIYIKKVGQQILTTLGLHSSQIIITRETGYRRQPEPIQQALRENNDNQWISFRPMVESQSLVSTPSGTLFCNTTTGELRVVSPNGETRIICPSVPHGVSWETVQTIVGPVTPRKNKVKERYKEKFLGGEI